MTTVSNEDNDPNARNPMLYDPLQEGNVRTTKTMQYVATIVICLGAISAGTALAWTAPVLPQLSVDEDDPLYMTVDRRTWTSSLLAIGALVSALPSGFIADVIGRKYTAIVMDIPFIISWASIIFANAPGWLYFGRFMMGISVGSFCVIIPMYISEIAETSIRGTLGTFFQLFLTIGILLVYVVGAFVNWVYLSAVCSLFPIALLVSMFFLPETPTYLLKKGRRGDAALSLKWLWGRYCDSRTAIQQIQNDLDKTSGGASFMELFTKMANLKGLGISMTLMFFQQFSGINAVIFFTVEIFKSAGSTLNASVCSIIVGVVQVLMTFVSALLIERAGRKILLLFSSTIMAVCLAILGTYFNLKHHEHDVSGIGWLPLLSVVLFIVAFSVGYGPIPWLMMGEIFVPSVKGLAASLSVLFNWILVFVVTKSFDLMVLSWGSDFTFWFFSTFMIIGTLFVAFFVFETKGKTAAEIQMQLEGVKPTSISSE